MFNALVVLYPLHQVTGQPSIEKANGQPHEFDQKIGDQPNVHPSPNVQEHPASQKTNSDLSKCQHHLGNQNHINEIQVASRNARIDDRLQKKRENEGNQTSKK